jgi:hypothetical protein
MRRALLSILAGVIVVGAGRAHAQTATDERVWASVTFQERVSATSAWRWSMEVIARSRDGVGELDALNVRPILHYDLTSRSSVGFGYALVPSFPPGGGVSVEHRSFGQFVWSGRVAAWTLGVRTRVEARWLEGNSGVLGRVRQQVRVSRPVQRGSTLSVVLADEFMLQVNDTTRSPAGVDQNRVFAGVSKTLPRAARLEVGYLNQFSPGHGRGDRRNHVLSLGLTF